MRRAIFLLAFLFSPCAVFAQSGIASCALNMTAGTWQQMDGSPNCPTPAHLSDATGFDMFFQSLPSGGYTGEGGFTFATHAEWDSMHHTEYLWSGNHTSQSPPLGSDVCNPPTTPNKVACADVSQRFMKYTDATNTFSNPIDSVTGYKHSGEINGTGGGHTYNQLSLDPLTGNAYKLFTFDGPSFQQWDSVNSTWVYKSNTGTGIGQNQMGGAWFPEAGGYVLANGAGASGSGPGDIRFWSPFTNTWTIIMSGLTIGADDTVAIYNPVRHEMLVGSGTFNTQGAFYIIKYSQDGVWSSAGPYLQGVGSYPSISECGNSAYDFRPDDEGFVGPMVVDPVSGKYLIVAHDASCNGVLYAYDSVANSWANITSSSRLPAAVFSTMWPAWPGTWACEWSTVTEYGVIKLTCQSGTGTTTPYGVVWLYKPDAVTANAPTTPTGLTKRVSTASTAEFQWNGSTAGSGGTLGGYKIYVNGVYVGGTIFQFFNITGLSANTTYSVQVSAQDLDGKESTRSSAVNVTTDVQAYTFAQKCALSGVVHCEDWDNQNELIYYWPTTAHGGSEWLYGSPNDCDTQLGTIRGYTNVNALPFYNNQTFTVANTVATISNGHCNWPQVDNSNFHSGGGSIKFSVVSHSGVAIGGGGSAGEFYGIFHHYVDGTNGYFGPTTSTPTADAHHEGDELWLQWYMMLDSGFLNTDLQQTYGEDGIPNFQWQTASAGSTHVTMAGCVPNMGYIPAGAAGKNIWFTGGANFTVLNQSIAINSVDSDGCGIVLATSPTPSAAGGGSPFFGFGQISGGGSATGQKNLGVFGNPTNTSCCGPSMQVSVDNNQMGIPSVYSWGQSTVVYYTADFNQLSRGYLDASGTPHGSLGTNAHTPQFDQGSLWPEPPSIRYHPNQWQEITVHIIPSATDMGTCPASTPTSNYHSTYEMYVDGQLVWKTNQFQICFGLNGYANGLGQFNFSPYQTAKDPNQAYTDTYIWYDDFIVSSNPIPMLSVSTGNPVTPAGGAGRSRRRRP